MQSSLLFSEGKEDQEGSGSCSASVQGKFPLTQTAEEQIPGEIAAASPWVVEGALGQAVGPGKRAAVSYQHSSMTGTSYRNAENFEVIK